VIGALHERGESGPWLKTAPKGSMRRVPSRREMKRSESVPALPSIWEPNEGEEGFVDSGVPSWMHSGASIASEGDSWRYSMRALDPHHVADQRTPWETLLSSLAQSEIPDVSAASLSELVVAAHDSLHSKAAAPLLLQSGMLEDHYDLKQELASGERFEVVEGVHRQSQRNYSLKIISRRGAHKLRAAGGSKRQLDPMRSFYLICSFVDEVYATADKVCLCMKWGSHEVDASHQMACLVLDALDLLFELLPPNVSSPYEFPKLDSSGLQRLLLRSMALDTFLQDHLWLPDGSD